MWSGIAGIAVFGSTAVAPGFFPYLYFLLSAIGYGLLLPVIATLHVLHRPLRQSGTVLGTIAGTSVVILGLVATATFLAAIFVAGVWWWTIGKLWLETGVLPRTFGALTMGLALLCFAFVILAGVFGTVGDGAPAIQIASWASTPLVSLLLGPWLLMLAALLWRAAR